MATEFPGSALLPLSPLLITESEEEFNRIREALYEEIKPDGVIESMYVDEIADLVWQIIRLKRCKAGVINLGFHSSSAAILGRFMGAGPDVARDWISDPTVAKAVEDHLATYRLDGSIIIADAINRKSRELEPIDTLLVSLETRRDKALVRIAQYRGELGMMLRQSADRLIDSKVVEMPRAATKKKSRRRQADGTVVELDGTANPKKDSAASMASERQVAANRRNALKSTGPRSEAGKRRASRNAYRHGLAAAVGHSVTGAAEIDALASAIAVAATGFGAAAADAEILAFARAAAHAECERVRIRALKAAAMSALMAAANLPVVVPHFADKERVAIAGSGEGLSEGSPAPASRLPSSGPTPDADAVNGPLTELRVLDRYEQRAMACRDRAFLNLLRGVR
jgi:hypothetical protein